MDNDNPDILLDVEDAAAGDGEEEQGGLAIVVEPHLLQNPEDVALLQEMLWGNDQDDWVQSTSESEGAVDEVEELAADDEALTDGVGEDSDDGSDEEDSDDEPSDDAQAGPEALPGLIESETDSEALTVTDSEDEYRRATTRRVSRHAAAAERLMPAGVAVDMPTAEQRGCVLSVLPDQCGAFECSTRVVHFQTMDCLALVPRPRPSPPAAPATSGNSDVPRQPASLPGASSTHPQTKCAAADRNAAAGEDTAVGASSSAGTSVPAPPGGGRGRPGVAASGACGYSPDEEIEVLIGGPERLSICRVPAPGQPGQLRVVCSTQLYSNHYSLAVCPDGHFIAAGGEGGFLYIYAYVREGAGGTPATTAAAVPTTGAAATAAAPTSTGPEERQGTPDGRSPGPVPSPGPRPESGSCQGAASLIRLAVFRFPVGNMHHPGMNNMIRFGHFGGRLRLMVAVQDREIFLFNVPAWSTSAADLQRITPADFCCPGLNRWVTSWTAPAADTPTDNLSPPRPPPPPPPPQQQQQQPQQQSDLGKSQGYPGAIAEEERGRRAGCSAGPSGSTATGAEPGGGVDACEPKQCWPNQWASRYWGGGGMLWPSDAAGPGAGGGPGPAAAPAASKWLALRQRHPELNPDARTAYFAPLNPLQDLGSLALRAFPRTSSICNFPSPLNCAESSPDAQWLAVGCDEPLIYLVPAGSHYYLRRAEVLLAPLPRNLPGRLAPGCQYVKFNDTSDRLAASFDALFSVFVFDVHRRQLLFSMRHQQWQPPLALSFVPGQPSLLLHATDRQHVVVVDVDAPRTTLTRISIKSQGARQTVPAAAAATDPSVSEPAVAAPVAGQEPDQQTVRERLREAFGDSQMAQRKLRRRPHINGMVTTADGRLMVATNTELLTFRLLLPDSPHYVRTRHHRLMPPGYKAAVRSLLMCAHSRPADAAGTAAAGAAPCGDLSAGQPSAAAAAAAAAAPDPAPGVCGPGRLPTAAPSDGGGWADGAGGPSSSLQNPPPGIWSLPADTLEHIMDASCRHWRAWADTRVEDVLAFPSLKFGAGTGGLEGEDEDEEGGWGIGAAAGGGGGGGGRV